LADGKPILSTFYDIGRDLINLEITTIEKPNLTGEKMPPLPHALLDIAENYLDELTKKFDLSSFWDLSRSERPNWNPQYKKPGKITDWKKLSITDGPETFDKLRWAATCAIWADEALPEEKRHYNEKERVILFRIRRNCDRLKNIIYDLKKESSNWNNLLNERTRLDLLSETKRYLPMNKLPIDYATSVRKIWDMGTENVCMQTIIQIDGDVITRIQSGLSATKQNLILGVHERGVEISIRYWKTLFDIVKLFVNNLTELFLPRSNTGE